MSEQIVITNSWQIRELKDANISDLAFGKTGTSPMDGIETLTDNVRLEHLEAILGIGTIAGDCDRVRWLYHSVQADISILLNNYDLSEDGAVHMTSDQLRRYRNYVAADAMFHSIVTSAKRFIDKTEKLLERYFGKNSEQYKQWRNTTSSAYDQSLVYALMYDLRNCVEHEFWIISVVNMDEANKRAGFAINIDNDLMNLKGLKSGLKLRLKQWAKDRLDENAPAWFSLGKCLETYRSMILALYALWLSSITGTASSIIKEYDELLSALPGNIVIWSGSETSKYSATGQRRAYRIVDESFLLGLERETACLNNLLSALIGEEQ